MLTAYCLIDVDAVQYSVKVFLSTGGENHRKQAREKDGG